MPYIHTKVSTVITPAQELSLKSRLGEAITLIPGKSEQWLMTSFEDRCRMYFRGEKDQPTAFVDVKIYGEEDPAAFGLLTGKICEIFREILGIAPDHVYVAYHPVSQWGWNGENF